MRFVVAKLHQTEGMFWKKNNFFSMSLYGTAPRDYTMQYIDKAG